MKVYNLADNRALCWDEFFIEKQSNVDIRMHRPEKKDIAVLCDEVWEGNVNGYASVGKEGDKYIFRYRAAHVEVTEEKTDYALMVYCMMESTDGKKFQRCYLDKYKYNEDIHNNIFHLENRSIDNFAVFLDENPNCPCAEKYKALSLYHQDGQAKLALYISENGIDFTFSRMLPLEGGFDSYNVLLWDDVTEQYYLYYRANEEVKDKWNPTHREVFLSTSKDFVSFDTKGAIDFGAGMEGIQLYTNQIMRYKRAKDMFIGFPMRYVEREAEVGNFTHFPSAKLRELWIKQTGRGGYALTDTGIMTSRDGYHFKRWDEAYLTPGIATEDNWWYGNTATAYGLVETASDIAGEPDELSLYVVENYRTKKVNWRRYSVRMDGFFSWYAKYSGGEVLTIPFLFTGNELEINFSTSALGQLVVAICDEDGNELEGYDSGVLFGDSIARIVDFPNALSELNGKAVRLKFKMKDCNLYSYKFNQFCGGNRNDISHTEK